MFDQLIANFYEPGEGLVPHIDLERFEDGILVANLQGTCIMDFTKSNSVYSTFLDVGDVIILSGKARWEWKHGIKESKSDVHLGVSVPRTRRISLTLRKLK